MKDRPPVQVGEVGSVVPTLHSKVVATTHPGHSHVPHVEMYINGDTVGDYIQRGPLRGGWSPGTLM